MAKIDAERITINVVEKIVERQKWIPCSERQPEEKGEYLITILVDAHMCKPLYETKIGSWRGKSGWYHETYSGVVATYYVLAWMPLPEPYKEGEE